MNNPNCDKQKCTMPDSEIRFLPFTTSGSGLFVCYSCYLHEIAWRIEQNKIVSCPFSLPEWENLTTKEHIDKVFTDFFNFK